MTKEQSASLTTTLSDRSDVSHHVLHVANYVAPHVGGVELHMHMLCGQLGKYLDVREVGGGGPRFRSQHTQLDGVSVARLATPIIIRSTCLAPSMPMAIRRSKAALVHLHLPNPFGAAAYLASGHKGPLVVTWHFEVVRQRWLDAICEPFVAKVLERSSAIITSSPQVAEYAAALRPFQDRIRVIPYGIDHRQLDRYDAAQVKAIRERYGPKIVFGVGRLIYYKGWEYLINAMREVDAKLLIVGDGPLLGAIERQIELGHLENRVFLLGMKTREELAPLYQACDVFVLSSVEPSEAFGLVQLEAMAARKPVINTMLDSGVPFVSRHEESGLTVAPRDPRALAEGINRLLEDPALREAYGLAGRRRVERDFNLERMTLETLGIYGEALGDNALTSSWKTETHRLAVPPAAQKHDGERRGRIGTLMRQAATVEAVKNPLHRRL